MTKRIISATCPTPDRPVIYVLRGEQGDMLIDTGCEGTQDFVDSWITENGFDLKWIFLTHGHFDHVWNAKFLKEKYGSQVILHTDDVNLFKHRYIPLMIPTSEASRALTNTVNVNIAGYLSPVCPVDVVINDEDTGYLRKIGFDADIVMLHGHTPGSMGIIQGRVLYSGDACSAKGGDYYTSIFGANVDEVLESEGKIFEINPLIIAPGHGKLIINERAFPD